MVVSKDNKRRRKETETPPTSSSVVASTMAVESSPEMPKRTKVQAQRKFAQGQNAPGSAGAFNAASVAAAAAAAAAASGPSTSADSHQPPIEILPNKCPKPQDFLTFLCFRGTSALPAHLDYLNQGKSKANEVPPSSSSNNNSNDNNNKKNNSNMSKNKKKRGRPSKTTATPGKTANEQQQQPQPQQQQQQSLPATDKTASDKIEASATPPPPHILAGAVRKRAEVITEGNRRGPKRNETLKRRSNRANKDKDEEQQQQQQQQQQQNNEDDPEEEEDEDEFFSAHDASSRNGGADETLSKSETANTNVKRGKATRKVAAASPAVTESSVTKEKEKGPVKRVRQRESPIFIPSPESSGRMTRQRAFFEPVKVLPKQQEPEEKEEEQEEEKSLQEELKEEKEEKQVPKKATDSGNKQPQLTKEKTNSSIYAKDAAKQQQQQLENGGTASAVATEQQKGLNVFDFSSDDEQPLAKSIKLKKGAKKGATTTAAAATVAARGRKSAKKQQQQQKEEEKVEVAATPTPTTPEEQPKPKRGKAVKKKAEEAIVEEKEKQEKDEDEEQLSPPLSKKQSNSNHNVTRPNRRQAQNKATKGIEAASPNPNPQRSQRPSRKTKEAAAIYMGIIGHKLQLADDEEDDLSLSSFPDIPNVKEMEKMEKEIKKNAAGKASEARKKSPKPAATAAAAKTATAAATTAAAAATATVEAVATVAVAEAETTAATAAAPPRRGRPPKQTKGATKDTTSTAATTSTGKPQIEGMLVKKGSLALAKAKSEQQQQQQKQHQQQKVDSDAEEDFLINEELNETKRKLEKSFSDSDDEPLAIKVPTAAAAATSAATTAKASNSSSNKTDDATAATSVATTTAALTATTTIAAGTAATTATAVTPAAAAATTMLNCTPPKQPTQQQQQQLQQQQQQQQQHQQQLSSHLGTSLNATPPTQLTMLPLTAKPTPTAFSISPPSYAPLKTMEKKSPVPTSKILNVPATYALPGTAPGVGAGLGAVGFAKTTSYLPQASPHYHTPYVRPATFVAAATAAGNKTPQHQQQTTMAATAATVTSPLKYQTPPTTYPPPIEAYQCPKINPNFLTPKYERSSVLPRANNINAIGNSSSSNNMSNMNNFTAPNVARASLSSLSATTAPAKSVLPPPVVGQSQSLNLSMTTTTISAVASTSAAAAAASVQQQQQQQQQSQQYPQQQQQQQQQLLATPTTATQNSNSNQSADPLKDEIGSILAQATLMPSKEESGKIFGIASVSLAQSSGPDNTKCTLGKCGSIHKPVLGPVVPTEGYFGDQLTSKERRKAKVNMTHEQIQKWLIECSSNPDEIQDDLDDEYDDSMRPQQPQTPPGPARDDKESTSFSSSSNKTRGELGKSESAWSAKGPSLKATPVVVSNAAATPDSNELDFDKCPTPVNLTQKSQLDVIASDKKLPDKKGKQLNSNLGKTAATVAATTATATTAAAGNKRNAAATPTASPTPTKQKAGNKKNANAAINNTTAAATTTAAAPPTTTTSPAKRTPIYQNQGNKSKAQQQQDNKQQQQQQQLLQQQQLQAQKTATTSVYAFGKEEEATTATGATAAAATKATNRRRNAAEAETTAATTTTTATPALSERSPTKKRAAAAAAATAVQLTLSPTDKLEKPKATAAAARNAKKQQEKQQQQQEQKQQQQQQPPTTAIGADSDAEGATFYIPLLQGASGGEGGIQGVAVKLGREGPDGPNQKVVMQATLVTKAQMDTNSKPLPDNELVKTLLNAATTTGSDTVPTTTAAAASNVNNNSSSLKASTSAAAAAAAASATTTTGNSGLIRVNSNSSLFSGSAKSRTAAATVAAATTAATASALAKKYKDDTPIKMANNTAFPRHDDPTQMVEAPIFKPTEKEFADPIEFIERITPIAARFGICKIIPPASFKPECRISDEMRFTAYNQYVHKMLHRWGPSAKELSAIKKYLATQSIVMNHAPWIGGMEVDLPRLYHTVQELGGLKEVIEKKKWARVAEEMCIPKLAQDRVTKLDDIYCKYLLPYDTLSPAERQKLFDEVEADWAKREARARRNADRFVNSTESVSNEEDDVSTDEDEESEEEIDGVSMECIVKGRSMPLSQFYRIARNTMALWFKSTDPTVNEVEAEFWRHVAVRDSHVCVHSGSIDSSGWGYGFPSPGPKGKGSNYARHPWNLKVLTNNAGSVLRSLGPVMGVTVPTLHVGMLFSACCWYRDPHGLSWIEYLHTGASKLWYGIPDDQSANFRSALTSLIPTHCQNKTIWLPCDTVMVPPHMLTDRGVSLCRIEQKPGEFIVVFPRAYTSSLATGYVVSESVYFATMSWLDLAKDDFRDIHESCEPAMFSLEQLLFALGYDQRVNSDTLQQMLPMLNEVCEKESAAREQLRAAGVTSTEKVQAEKGQKAKKQQQPPFKSIESECDLCRANLYISMVRTEDGNVYCLQHALKNLNNGNIQAKQCKLIYAYNVDDVQQLIRQLQEKIQHKAAVKKK